VFSRDGDLTSQILADNEENDDSTTTHRPDRAEIDDATTVE
jgi:hypothetical protein